MENAFARSLIKVKLANLVKRMVLKLRQYEFRLSKLRMRQLLFVCLKKALNTRIATDSANIMEKNVPASVTHCMPDLSARSVLTLTKRTQTVLKSKKMM